MFTASAQDISDFSNLVSQQKYVIRQRQNLIFLKEMKSWNDILKYFVLI